MSNKLLPTLHLDEGTVLNTNEYTATNTAQYLENVQFEYIDTEESQENACAIQEDYFGSLTHDSVERSPTFNKENFRVITQHSSYFILHRFVFI